MSTRENGCAHVTEKDLIPLYLVGKLAESDAHTLEEHLMGCDRCWAEVMRAGEVRRAFGRPLLEDQRPMKRSRTAPSEYWTPLAAAAVVAVLAVGLVKLSDLSAGPMLRSSRADRLEVTVKADRGGDVQLHWPVREDASSYRVIVFRSDGLPILERSTKDNRITLNATEFPKPANSSLLVRVEALNPMHEPVASSKPVPFSTP